MPRRENVPQTTLPWLYRVLQFKFIVIIIFPSGLDFFYLPLLVTFIY